MLRRLARAVLPETAVLPLTHRYQQRLVDIAERAQPTADREWERLKTYDESEIEAFAASIAPLLNLVRRAAAVNTIGYLSVLVARPPLRVAVEHIEVETTFRKPFIAVWQARQADAAESEAVGAGRRRLQALVHDHVISVARRAGDAYAAASELDIARWRRVPSANACEWCHSVAGGVFRSAASADFGHQRCRCTPVPVLRSA